MGISFHVASTVLGLATVGEIIRPALDATGDLWAKLSAIGAALQKESYQKSVAVPAIAGIPITHRGVSRSFAVVTGHTRDGGLPDLPVADTLVVLMGVNPLKKIVVALLAQGWPAATPAAVIAEGTTPRQRVVTGTLADIADRTNGLEPPAVLVVGEVVRLRADLAGLKVP